MGEEIKVVIPSAGRWDAVTTTKYVANCILCVPKSQESQYLNLYSRDQVVSHPDSVKGMGAKRNWICEHFGSVFMIDDDTTGIKRMYSKDGKRCTPGEAYNIIQAAGNMAINTGCVLFGFNKKATPLSYTGLKPFAMKGWVNGVGMGIIKNKMLKFSTEITCNNDVFISLLNAFYFHRCFIDNRYVVTQKGINKNTGGMSAFRTEEAELRDIKLIQEWFGPAVKLRQKAGSAKKFNLLMKLPF